MRGERQSLCRNVLIEVGKTFINEAKCMELTESQELQLSARFSREMAII